MHAPWDHRYARDFLCRVRDKFKPDRIVNLGDEVDLHGFSAKWPADPNLHSPARELELARESLARYYKEFPNVDVLESNHGARIFRKVLVSGLPRMVIKRYSELFGWPKGWHYAGDHLIIDGVYYTHGEGISGGSWHLAHQKLKCSVVLGHLHSRAGVIYSVTKRYKHFVLNAGCLIDTENEDGPFAYGKHIIEKPVLGCGLIVNGEQAMFIPMGPKGKLL
jgi:hypothetical protein